MVKGPGLERSGLPGVAVVAGLEVGAKQASVDLRFRVAGHTVGLGLIVAVVHMAGITLYLAVFTVQRKPSQVVVESLYSFVGGVETAAFVFGVARGALVYVIQSPVQALLVLHLACNIAMAIHTEHSLVFL